MLLERREGSRSRVGSANDRPCESTRYLLYEIALALEPPTVVSRKHDVYMRGVTEPIRRAETWFAQASSHTHR